MTFACEGDTLVGAVDEAPGTTGVLIVSGGNEIRCGAHRGMALLAKRLAAAEVPVFRFDRRGVGDSEGENRGYSASESDIAAALTAFRREQPQVSRLVGFGNCDAATALALFDTGCDALVLVNPWLGNEDAPLPPASLRRHYIRQMRSPAAWRRGLARLTTALGDLRAALSKAPEQPLAGQIAQALHRRPTTIVLASRDRTAQVFAAAVRPPTQVKVVQVDTASHSFAGQGDALERILLDAVATALR